ncbi:uncharacterized protein LOC115570996 [Sparus aurata]|uniref:uncharacterized protein LOC115570996 n=1 Tax=Sparus aurata TaxID=8175 RepID=UPI0011C1AF49|nr:uncharacterized protein LOC115570996 [Sparus aurata]XP_030255795.1 uncharacterized protein LOC115570996 [Sparus aurata]
MKKKIFIVLAGNTLKSHEKIIKKLEKRGAKTVETLEESEATIVFCPIVSRFETDVNAALSNAEDLGCKKVILVAMHHTFNKDYPLPHQRGLNNPAITVLVDYLFFETKGILSCDCNKRAFKTIRKELGLPKHSTGMKIGKKKKSDPTN